MVLARLPPSRIACLVVPDLPLQALVRAEPALLGEPVAVTEAPGRRAITPPPLTIALGGPGARGRSQPRSSTGASIPPANAPLVHVNHEARSLAVRTGMTVAQARAICPSLVVRAAHPEQVAAARAALLDAALGFAPRVEPGPAAMPDSVCLEVGDLGRLHADEAALGAALRAGARAVGMEVGVGIAGSKGVARLAAWRAALVADGQHRLAEERGLGAEGKAAASGLREGAVIAVPAGGEARFAGALPVPLLVRGAGVDDRTALALGEALARWGVRDGARLAALPVREVVLRLGEPGARLHRLASGRTLDGDPLAAAAPPDACEEGMELDFALYEVEPLAFVVRGLLDRVLVRLGARHLACAGLALRLKLDSGGHDVREVPVAAPTRDAPSLLQLVRLDVERRPPTDAVVGITLVARAACARPDQLDLFRAPGPAPDRLAATLAKLEALCGPGAVGSPRPADTHREEAVDLDPFAGRTATATGNVQNDRSGSTGHNDAALGLRRFRPARTVEVILDGGATPRALRGDGIACQVVVATGPFRVQGEWWDASGGFARDYWDVHATDGALYRLYRDRAGEWFVAGYYD